MTREQIKEHYADMVMSVFMMEDAVKPTLQERMAALGENPASWRIDEVGRQYCLDIAEEILSRTPDDELAKLYMEE